jgi:phosphoglycolate phosphatase-like HAD superfamily hydrolase
MIGDRSADVEAAAAARIRSIMPAALVKGRCRSSRTKAAFSSDHGVLEVMGLQASVVDGGHGVTQR